MQIKTWKILRQNFGVRLFAAFLILIVIISFSFTATFIRYENQALYSALLNKGELLIRILSHTSRIGVFSENQALLKSPIESIFQQREVIKVNVFNHNGKVLMQQTRAGFETHSEPAALDENVTGDLLGRLERIGAIISEDYEDKIILWSPIFSGTPYTVVESLFLEENPIQEKREIIGFAQITIEKSKLNNQLNALLIKSLFIGVLFLLIGSFVAFLIVKGITKPLLKLTEAARHLEKSSTAEKVAIHQEDEIGKLAAAFNSMSASLKKREDALKESEKRLRILSSQLMRAQEEERTRISKELHDELGQALALLKHRIRSIARISEEGQASVLDQCEETGRYVDTIIENVRRLSRDLSPTIIDDLGLTSSLRWLAENFSSQHAVATSLDIEDIDHLFSKEIQTNLFRISQEALTNIGKHSEAEHISFVVKKNEAHVGFEVSDDGKGFDVRGVKEREYEKKGVGLEAMRERANIMGASMEIISHLGGGTRILMTIPIQREEQRRGAVSHSPG